MKLCELVSGVVLIAPLAKYEGGFDQLYQITRIHAVSVCSDANWPSLVEIAATLNVESKAPVSISVVESGND